MFNIIGTIGAIIGFLAKFIRKDGHGCQLWRPLDPVWPASSLAT